MYTNKYNIILYKYYIICIGFCKMAILRWGMMTAYRRDATHWTEVARRTRITNVVIELLPTVLEPLYVSSSFFTTSLGCLSYSAVSKEKENGEKSKELSTFSKNPDVMPDILYTSTRHSIQPEFRHFSAPKTVVNKGK